MIVRTETQGTDLQELCANIQLLYNEQILNNKKNP